MSKQDNYIISAGDENFYLCFKQLMYSYERHHEYDNSKIVFFDLGLNDQQKAELEDKAQENDWLEIRMFDFSKYPSYYNPKNQNYAWKPTLIHEVLEEKKGNLFYLDSANLILKNLKPIWETIESKGTYVPLCGTGLLEEWTLDQTLEYLNVSDALRKSRNRAGNTCGFSYHHPEVRELVKQWKNFAAIEECIHPHGANRNNHKSDQSILTILLLQFQEKGAIELTQDEVDISCSRPTKYISVRKKVSEKMILPIGPLTYIYFLIQRQIDILVNKIAGN
ncbi:DUF1647 domain-containing protein [Ekhidna sp.]|uniref:DUF1647 domain-containing protein n=1 Tax=Ekhidna sp. TaxID=2608089 RepID=UPI0032EB1656